MANSTVPKVIPCGSALGAEVKGLKLGIDLDEKIWELIFRAWNKHLVLRFRDQNLDEEMLIGFSARFGKLEPAPTRPLLVPNHPSRPEINVVSNILVDGTPIGGLGNSELIWHQDMSYRERPPKASVLYALETHVSGGDRHFYNLYSAFETLSSELKKRIETLSCKHDATRNSAGQLRAGFEETYSNQKRPGAIHPLVIRHPETGRQSLNLGRRPNAWIVGLSDVASDALLDELWDHIEDGPRQWTQQWRARDLVDWANRCTLHRRGSLDPAQRRLMYRPEVFQRQLICCRTNAMRGMPVQSFPARGA